MLFEHGCLFEKIISKLYRGDMSRIQLCYVNLFFNYLNMVDSSVYKQKLPTNTRIKNNTIIIKVITKYIKGLI